MQNKSHCDHFDVNVYNYGWEIIKYILTFGRTVKPPSLRRADKIISDPSHPDLSRPKPHTTRGFFLTAASSTRQHALCPTDTTCYINVKSIVLYFHICAFFTNMACYINATCIIIINYTLQNVFVIIAAKNT